MRSASLAGTEPRSASEAASTASMPSRWQATRTRTAISPRLATRMRRTIAGYPAPVLTRIRTVPCSANWPSARQISVTVPAVPA